MSHQTFLQFPRTLAIPLATLVAGLAIGSFTAIGQARTAPPTEHRGVGVDRLGVVSEQSMHRQIGLRGYILQLRRITIEPDGAIARHDHAGRPGLVWTVEGTWIEGRADRERAWPAGGSKALVENADTVHWIYNRGSAPATAIVCDVVPAP